VGAIVSIGELVDDRPYANFALIYRHRIG
jgi:hypothetical protein